MKKPNKTYTLTIVYNEESEEVEYLQETICVDDANEIEKSSMFVDLSDYWDEESLELVKDSYCLAET